MVSERLRECAPVEGRRMKALDMALAVLVVSITVSQLTLDGIAIRTSLHDDYVGDRRGLYEDVSYRWRTVSLHTAVALQPLGTHYGRIFWTELMTYIAFVANVVLAFFVLIVLSLEWQFEKSNILIRKMGHDRTEHDLSFVVDKLYTRMEANFVLLKALAATTKVFQVRCLRQLLNGAPVSPLQNFIFLQVLLLVPRFVDSSWHVQEGARSVVGAVGAAQSVVKTAAIVVGLVLIPANLHATVSALGDDYYCCNMQLKVGSRTGGKAVVRCRTPCRTGTLYWPDPGSMSVGFHFICITFFVST